ncbi:hypothetical protein CDCA_CDCA20G4849 [Cyanidium caldarium]|uniref:Aspartate aminotransferase n=1 Tax=Cyanidium caldarium TaxID=2771 RepID=A0AAV9J2Q1_CYACA|nr:hypothetical protein CDCA_CDCA20G4849 [Cyanidium caldarium]
MDLGNGVAPVGAPVTSTSATTSVFASVPEAPQDPILGLNELFREDPSPHKVNLGVGAYRTDENRPYVLGVVKRIEQEMAADTATVHEYLPIEGWPEFRRLSAHLVFGADAPALREERVVTLQSLSGTGSLRVVAEFLAHFYRPGTVCCIPQPTWGNHKNIFPRAGLPVREYRYYDDANRGLDYDGMVEDLEAAPTGSIVVLHACAHNPTGADPDMQQWQGVLEVVRRRRHFPLFDCAYQGFASGSFERDAAAIRLFAAATPPLEMAVTQSFAKNMGLYGERVGALHVVCAEAAVTRAVMSQLKQVARAMYSSPPGHGAAIVTRVLRDPALFAEWETEVQVMSGRIMRMRRELHQALQENGTPGNWGHVLTQIGMFSFTGLSASQCLYLRERYYIYMTSNGRISMAGLTSDKVRYLADAMKDAVLHAGKDGGSGGMAPKI